MDRERQRWRESKRERMKEIERKREEGRESEFALMRDRWRE